MLPAVRHSRCSRNFRWATKCEGKETKTETDYSLVLYDGGFETKHEAGLSSSSSRETPTHGVYAMFQKV